MPSVKDGPSSTTAPAPQSGSLFPWSQPFRDGLKRRQASGRPKRHETMREPMERRQGGGRPAARAGHSFLRNAVRAKAPPAASGGFAPAQAPAPAPRPETLAGASSCARLSVRLSVPMVAAVISGFRTKRTRSAASRRIHHRTRGASAVPVRHNRVGQYAISHLSLLRNPLLREHPQGRVYVRSLTAPPPDIARRRTANVRLARRLGSDGVWPRR